MDDIVSVDDAMNAIAGSIMPEGEFTPEEVEEVQETAVDLGDLAKGVLNTSDDDDDDEESDDEPEVKDEKPKEAEYAEVKTIDDELQAEFSVFDDDGEFEIPNVKVKYKANGQVREDRLDQVVKLAQMGVYNEQRQNQIKGVEQQAQEVRGQLDKVVELVKTRESQIERLLTDDKFLSAKREEFEKYNSPDSRAERAEKKAQSVESRYFMQDVARKGQAFYTGEVAPAIELIANALPNVTSEELAERMVAGLQAHMVKGPDGTPYLPESGYAAARNYIVQDLAVWASGQDHLRKAPATSTPSGKKAQDAVEKAQIEAQKAKRAVGKKTRPVGKARAGKESAKAKPIDTVDDAVNSALESVLSGFN